jgi:hypothetical protein
MLGLKPRGKALRGDANGTERAFCANWGVFPTHRGPGRSVFQIIQSPIKLLEFAIDLFVPNLLLPLVILPHLLGMLRLLPLSNHCKRLPQC